MSNLVTCSSNCLPALIISNLILADTSTRRMANIITIVSTCLRLCDDDRRLHSGSTAAEKA